MKNSVSRRAASLVTALVMIFSLSVILPNNKSVIVVSATQNKTANFKKNYSLTGNGADDIVAVAMAQKDRNTSQMGYTEAWCADFVGDCAALAGVGNIIPRAGYCGTLYDNIKKAGGKETSSPKKGDIIFYYCNASSCPNSGKPWVHVGIMTGSSSSIEGNSSSKVTYKSKITYTDCNGHTYGHSGTNLISVKYLRPNYKANIPVPEAPTLRLTTLDSSAIRLDWNKVEYATSYRIDKQGASGDYEQIGETTNLTYTDVGLNANTRYKYRVYALNSSGKSPKQEGIGAYTTQPKQPNLKVTALKNQKIKLEWNSVSHADYYDLQRRKAGEEKYESIKKTEYDTSYTDSGLEENTTYYYRIYAVNGEYYSEKPAGIGGFTGVPSQPTLTLTPVSDSTVKAEWTTVKNADHYDLQRRKAGAEKYESIKITDSDTSYIDSDLESNTTYYYRIYAVNGEIYSEKPAGIGVTTLCNHNFSTWTTTKAATCTTNGEQTRKCSSCGKTETKVISATGHKYTDTIIAPTCTSKGYTKHTCSACGDTYNDTETAAKGHSFGEWTTITPATCTNRGEQSRKCSSCGKTETNVIDAVGHNYVETVVEPTCTEGGHTDHVCSNCGDTYTDSETPAKGHNYTVDTIPPTDTEAGYDKHTCTDCGDFFIDNVVPPITVKTNPKVSYEKGNSCAKLTWAAVSSAQMYGIEGYRNGEWQLLDKTTDTSYILKNLKADTEYQIAVIAKFNDEWNMDFSNAITVTPKEATVNLYPAVQTQVKDSKIGFKWTKVPGAEKYGIGIYQANKWKVIKQLDGSVSTWTSPQVRNDTYRLVVLAKVDGQWVNADVFKKAFYVTVS